MAGDPLGALTCFEPRGNSCVDYCVLEYELLRYVNFFKVMPLLRELSDHCAIQVSLWACYTPERKRKLNLHNDLPVKYKYHGNPKQAFELRMNSTEVGEEIKNLEDEIDSPESNLNEVANEFTILLQ